MPAGQRPASTATSAPTRPGRLRNTRQAAAVEAALRDADGFRTAQNLFAELRRRGDRIGLTTVYRHLNMLAEQGRADVVHSAEGESQYRLCGVGSHSADEPGEHHHHLVCRVCGRSVEVSGPEVEAWADRVSAAAGYTEISHTLEVFGLCPEHSARRAGHTRRG
ncbi:MAG TPA: transcriptional repressor [Jatrophihabitantaceae bacterium]